MTLRILLVDDNRTFVAAITGLLTSLEGVTVAAVAHDGLDGLNLARQIRPDLLLLDIALPSLTGWDVARALQGDPDSPQIIFLSMHDAAAYRLAACEFGALAYVGKARCVAELVPLIEGLIDAKVRRGITQSPTP